MSDIKLFRGRILLVVLICIIQSVICIGCDLSRDAADLKSVRTPQPTRIRDIQVNIGDKDEYGGTVIAVDKFDNNYDIGALTAVSKDGRYYLFRLDTFDGNLYEASKNAKLVIWDSIDKKEVDRIEGKLAGEHMRNSVLDMENKRIYYDDMLCVNYIDLKQKKKVDVLSKFKIKPGKEYMDEFGNHQYNVGFLAFDNGNLFVCTRLEKDTDKPVCTLYRINGEECKKINIDIKEKIAFLSVLGIVDGNKMMCRINSKFYITDFDGNILEERPMIDNKDFNTLGSSYMYPSNDGRKLLYSLGKTPTDLYVYDFETREVKVLCPGGRNYLGMSIPSIREKYGECFDAFWAGNGRIIAKIALYEGEMKFPLGYDAVAAKEYEVN